MLQDLFSEDSPTQSNPLLAGAGSEHVLSLISVPLHIMIIILVNGNWTEWNQWGACSLAYNTTNGTEIRERTCSDPAPANNGLDCVTT
jgi:hypothetical protein